MQLHSMTIDNFLADFDGARTWADEAHYGLIVNPIDGVVYPGINTDIPQNLRDEVQFKLQLALGGSAKINMIFTRLSLQGVEVPHQAHNDATHGMMSLMVYLNRPEHCKGGTEFVTMSGDMEYGPADDYELEKWRMWTNEPPLWDRSGICNMKPNRAFIFDSRLMHRALPIGGFGDSPANGRLVLTAFFDLPQC